MAAKKMTTPFGLTDTGELVSARQAHRLKSYLCPACGAALLLKKGKVRKPYFMHPIVGQCDINSVWRRTAKLLIVESVKRWKAGIGKRPVIRRICFGCFNRRDFPLLDIVDGTACDVKLTNGKMADVVLLSDNVPIAAIQVFVTHSEETKELGEVLPWIDVSAKEIIANPTLWDSVCESLGYFECSLCEQQQEEQRKARRGRNRARSGKLKKKRVFTARKEIKMKKKKQKEHREIKKLVHQFKLTLPSNPSYIHKLFTCKGCNKKTIVFSWQNHLMCNGSDEASPPSPVPASLQLRKVAFDGELSFMNQPRFSSCKDYDEYYVNTCLHCKSSIRDESLYDYYHGPFGKEFFASRNKKNNENKEAE